MAKLEEVFGISSRPVLSYIARPQVDGKFVDAVASAHHVVVYGSSKQGKTALRQKHIDESKCAIYRCNPGTHPESIYQFVLRAAGVRIETTETATDSSKLAGKASWGIKASIPWVTEANAGVEGGGERTRQRSLTSAYIDVCFSDSQMVASMLADTKFEKFIVLENFHYLPREVQRTLSFDLKTFHETGIRFIILGVWREANQLLVLNPDLQDRIAEIPVEPWEEDDFDEVIEVGQKCLNVAIPDRARSEFKKNAFGNVGMVQEFLKVYCQLNNVTERRATHLVLDSVEKIDQALAKKAEDQRGRLLTILQGISARSRVDRRSGGGEPLTLPYYLVQVLLTAPVAEIRDGITRKRLHDRIRDLHRRTEKDTVRINDVAQLLQRIPLIQGNPVSPFLYYDSLQQRLRVVDAGLLFALAQVDRESIREEILDPLATYDDDASRSLFVDDEIDGIGNADTDTLAQGDTSSTQS